MVVRWSDVAVVVVPCIVALALTSERRQCGNDLVTTAVVLQDQQTSVRTDPDDMLGVKVLVERPRAAAQ